MLNPFKISTNIQKNNLPDHYSSIYAGIIFFIMGSMLTLFHIFNIPIRLEQSYYWPLVEVFMLFVGFYFYRKKDFIEVAISVMGCLFLGVALLSNLMGFCIAYFAPGMMSVTMLNNIFDVLYVLLVVVNFYYIKSRPKDKQRFDLKLFFNPKYTISQMNKNSVGAINYLLFALLTFGLMILAVVLTNYNIYLMGAVCFTNALLIYFCYSIHSQQMDKLFMSRYLAAAYFAMIGFHIVLPLFKYWNFMLVDFVYMFVVFTWFLKLKPQKK